MKQVNPLPIKYIVLASCISLLIIGATYFGVKTYIEKVTKDNFSATVDTQLSVVDKSIHQTISGVTQDLNMFAMTPIVQEIGTDLNTYMDQPNRQLMRPSQGSPEEQKLFEALSVYAKSHPGVIYAYIATEYGGYLCWPESEIVANYDPRVRPWYKAAIEGKGDTVLTNPYKDISKDVVLISQVKTIYGQQGEVVGVVGLDYSMDKLAGAINQTDVVFGGFYLLVHGDEMILSDPSHKENRFKELKSVYPEIQSLYKSGSVFEISISGQLYLGCTKDLTDTNWNLIVLSPKYKVYEASRDTIQSMMIGSVAGVLSLIIIVVAILYMLYYNRSLQKMVSTRTEDLQEMIDTLVTKEQSLIASEIQYSSLVDNLPGVVYRCEPYPPWQMKTISKWVENLTGYKSEDFLCDPPKVNWDDIVHPEDVKIVDKETSSADNYDFSTEYRIIAKDGTIRWVFEKGSLIETNYGEKYMDGVIFDNTDKKLASDELKKLYEELEDRVEERTKALKDAMSQLVEQEKMASLGGIVSGVAHEINTPLGIGVTVASYLKKISEDLKLNLSNNTLSKNKMNEFLNSNSESLGILETNLARAAELVNSFKKISVNQSTEDMVQFNLKDYLGMILLSLKHEYKNKNYQIEVECDPSIEIFTYPGVYSQIFTNFLMNSFIHGFKDRETGDVKIKALQYPAEKRLVITYNDNGHGIPEEILDRIFEPFFTTNRSNGGSGLGLYIVYNLVSQKLGGSINCHSVAEEGTTFVIDVPLITEQGYLKHGKEETEAT